MINENMDGLYDDLENELDFPDEIIEEVVIKDDDGFKKPEGSSEIADIFADEPVVKADSSGLINSLLEAKGIKESKLTMLDEDDKEIEVDFYSLTREEQLEILNAEEETEEIPPLELTGLSEGDQKIVDLAKKENLSLEDYLKQEKEAAKAEVAAGADPVYEIDNYDDDELFLLDLKNKYELTDEELVAELDKEKQNPEIFEKKTKKLREDYKELEVAQKQEEEAKFEQERSTQYNEFVEQMVDVAVKNNDLHGIELEEDEKNEVLSYLLQLDDEGTSEFYRQLNEPAKLFEAAWFMKYGTEAFSAITNAYEQEIKKLKDEVRDKPKPPKVVVKPIEQNKIQSIHDLEF